MTERIRGKSADVLAVRNIEVIFHTAGSVLPEKNLGLMMSIYADDAVLTDTSHDDKVYKGKEQVHSYWEQVAGPFRPSPIEPIDWLHPGDAHPEQRSVEIARNLILSALVMMSIKTPSVRTPFQT